MERGECTYLWHHLRATEQGRVGREVQLRRRTPGQCRVDVNQVVTPTAPRGPLQTPVCYLPVEVYDGPDLRSRTLVGVSGAESVNCRHTGVPQLERLLVKEVDLVPHDCRRDPPTRFSEVS